MNNHPLVMMTDGLLRFLTAETTRKNSGWQKETIFRLLKTFLLRDFTPEETDRLENYVLSHGIRAWQWHKAWKFREYWDIDAEAQPPSEKELAALREANDWRVRLTSLLDPLASAWKKAKTVREKCALLYQFYLDERYRIHLPGSMMSNLFIRISARTFRCGRRCSRFWTKSSMLPAMKS